MFYGFLTYPWECGMMKTWGNLLNTGSFGSKFVLSHRLRINWGERE